ncbi:MAG: isochorismatase family protein [Lachnospiraceae bacterium]|nr:isochorismatase family protein [Lachnospiraceae bacterium]
MRINKNDTLAIIVDYQERLMPAMADMEGFIKKSAILIEGLNILGVPMLVTQQYTKGLGQTVEPIRNAIGNDKYFDKTSFSVLGDEAIATAISSQNKKNIILCGAEAHICVLQTLIDLREKGYNVVLVEDCIASRCVENKAIALVRAEQEGALISTYEAILYELLEKAGSDEFKQISRLIK